MALAELKIQLAQMLVQLAQGEKAMAALAPDMALALEPLFGIPSEEVQKAVDKLVETMPEEKREEIVGTLCNRLQESIESQEFTKWRIDSRVQPLDKPRETLPFKSFCKRKGDGW